MDLIVMSVIAGALIMFGVQKRIRANNDYWEMMNTLAKDGQQDDCLPALDARRSNDLMNSNIAIGVGVLIIVAMVTN